MLLAGAAALVVAGCDDGGGVSVPPGDVGAVDGGTPADAVVEVDVGDGTVVGSPCDGPGDCANGLCVSTPSGGQCSVRCVDDTGCPAGWTCEASAAVGGQVCLPVPECPDLDGEDSDGDGLVDPCDACPDEAGDGDDGCPPPVGGLRLHGQPIASGGEMTVGRYTLRLVGGAREPAGGAETPSMTLYPISLGRTR